MTLDENLTLRDHVEVISKKISSGIGALKAIRGLIDQETAIKVYQVFIEPYFSYCAPVWHGLGHTLSENRAARVIPKPNTDYLKRSFSYSGAILWNNLPESLRLSPSFTAFKSSLESLYSRRTDSHTATR